MAQLLSICSESGDLAEGPNFQLHVSTEDRPGRVFCTITPAILCYAVGIYTGPGVPCRYQVMRRCSVTPSVAAGPGVPCRYQVLCQYRDCSTPSVPASSTQQASGLLLKPGGTPLRRRYRPWSTLQRYQVLCEIPGRESLVWQAAARERDQLCCMSDEAEARKIVRTRRA